MRVCLAYGYESKVHSYLLGKAMHEMVKVIQLLGKLTLYLGFFYVGGNESISLVPTMRCKTWL